MTTVMATSSYSTSYKRLPEKEKDTKEDHNNPTTREDILTDVLSIVDRLNDHLQEPFLNIFALSLQGLGIVRSEIYKKESSKKLKTFSELFINALYRKLDSNIQETINFTCSVLNRFSCTTHSNDHYECNLQQFASTEGYNMAVLHPEVHHRLTIAVSLYSLNSDEREQFITAMAEDMQLPTNNRERSVCRFVHLMCQRGRAGETIRGLELDPRKRWTSSQLPPDIIHPKRRRPSNKVVHRVLKPTCTILIISAVAIIILGLLTFLISPPTSATSFPVSVNYSSQSLPKLINPQGYLRTGHITLTATAPVIFRKFRCNDLTEITINKTLDLGRIERTNNFTEAVIYDNQPLSFKNGNRPLVLAPGSEIIITISASYDFNAKPYPTQYCLSLFLFDSQSEKYKFQHKQTASIIYNTSCITVGTPGSPRVSVESLPVTKQGGYFVQVRIPRYASFNISAKIIQISYNFTYRSSPICGRSTSRCQIKTCTFFDCYSYSQERTCLLAALDGNEHGNVHYSDYVSMFLGHRVATSFAGLLFAAAFILSIIIILSFLIYYCFVYCIYDRPRDVWANLA